MASTLHTIDHATLAKLVEAGAVQGASIVGQPGGWGLVIHYGKTKEVLAAKRGASRVFRKFETLVAYLKGIGIAKFQVDASHFDPVVAKTERRRVDATERLKNAHEAAAYQGWLAAQVQEAIDDPRPGVPHADVAAEWELERAELMKLAEGMRR